jgi:membrane protease YdiL (CAAX protease family)
MVQYLKTLFKTTWQETEQNSIEKISATTNYFENKSIIIILIYIALSLSIVKYYGDINSIMIHIVDKNPSKFATWFCYFFYGSDIGKFHGKLWWIGMIFLFYFIITVLIIKFGFKQRLRDYGLVFKNIHKDYPLYILMLCIMLPIVYFASMTHSFQARYPIFQPLTESLFPIFIWWQVAYFLQFVAVEFFFRGFILHGLKHRFGYYAIFISTIPYCMVHFGKPFGETIAAIIAGIVLGTLSLKSRSIVLGILIHYSVAITMDLFALYREGYF